MNRAIISQRITSILAEIERLNNALYAMNTTDIQRYAKTPVQGRTSSHGARLRIFSMLF